jgi:hypothetical protein
VAAIPKRAPLDVAMPVLEAVVALAALQDAVAALEASEMALVAAVADLDEAVPALVDAEAEPALMAAMALAALQTCSATMRRMKGFDAVLTMLGRGEKPEEEKVGRKARRIKTVDWGWRTIC